MHQRDGGLALPGLNRRPHRRQRPSDVECDLAGQLAVQTIQVGADDLLLHRQPQPSAVFVLDGLRDQPLRHHLRPNRPRRAEAGQQVVGNERERAREKQFGLSLRRAGVADGRSDRPRQQFHHQPLGTDANRVLEHGNSRLHIQPSPRLGRHRGETAGLDEETGVHRRHKYLGGEWF